MGFEKVTRSRNQREDISEVDSVGAEVDSIEQVLLGL